MLGDMNAWEQFSPGIDSLLVPGGFGQANYKVIKTSFWNFLF